MADTNTQLLKAVETLLFDLMVLAVDVVTPQWFALPVAEASAYRQQVFVLWKLILSLLPGAFTADMKALNAAVIAVANSEVGVLGAEVATDWHKLLDEILTAYRTDLAANKTIDPTKVDVVVGAALARASYLGLGSRAVTILFETFIPKSLNFMNWLGPVLAQFSGYEEIVARSRAPQYQHSFGNLAEYDAAQTFLTKAPDHFDAEQMYSRRLISREQLNRLIGWSGLMTEFHTPMLDTAYRAMQPRMFATLLLDQDFPADEVKDALQFAGLRDVDVTFLLPALKLASTKNVRQQYLSTVTRAAELGTLTDAEVDSSLTDLEFSDTAKHWVKLTIATRKLEQLAELYRKSVSEAYQFGTISDADYVPSLEAIGIAEPDARAHFAIDSIKKHGKEAAELARELAAATKFTDRTMIAAARADFHEGILDDVALAARFAAAQMPAMAIPFAVEIEIVRKATRRRIVFGKNVTPGQAVHLRERVAALKEQRIKKAIDDAAALAQLEAWGIPDSNAGDLVAAWAAQADKTKLPIP